MPRLFFVSFGFVALAIGVVTFWLPIPLGLPLIMLGLFLIMKYSPTGRLIILRHSKRFPVVFEKLKRIPKQRD